MKKIQNYKKIGLVTIIFIISLYSTYAIDYITSSGINTTQLNATTLQSDYISTESSFLTIQPETMFDQLLNATGNITTPKICLGSSPVCRTTWPSGSSVPSVNMTTNFGGEVSGTYDAIVLDHDALDDQYYDSEGDLTSLLDDNYFPFSGGTFTGGVNLGGNAITNALTIDANSYFAAPMGSLDDLYEYTTHAGVKINNNVTLTETLDVLNNVTTPRLCLSGDTCRTTWPAGGVSDTNCTVDGSCDPITYDSETSTWDKDSSNDLVLTTQFIGEVTGTFNGMVIDNNALDDQYYDSEGDLTALLDDNYVSFLNINDTVGNFSAWDKDYNDLINKPSGITDTNCTVDGSCDPITYDSETTNWDKDSSDDITTETQILNITKLNISNSSGISNSPHTSYDDLIINTGNSVGITLFSDVESGIMFGNSTHNIDTFMYKSNGGIFIIANEGTYMLVGDGENVGIKETSPDHDLDVNGDVNADSYYINGNQRITSNATCDVLIQGDTAVICVK
jgi:hypothetical protein